MDDYKKNILAILGLIHLVVAAILGLVVSSPIIGPVLMGNLLCAVEYILVILAMAAEGLVLLWIMESKDRKRG